MLKNVESLWLNRTFASGKNRGVSSPYPYSQAVQIDPPQMSAKGFTKESVSESGFAPQKIRQNIPDLMVVINAWVGSISHKFYHRLLSDIDSLNDFKVEAGKDLTASRLPLSWYLLSLRRYYVSSIRRCRTGNSTWALAVKAGSPSLVINTVEKIKVTCRQVSEMAQVQAAASDRVDCCKSTVEC